MKKIIRIFITSVFIVTISSSSCRKSNIDPGCDCSTDSVWHYATYNNFSGYDYQAWLNYVTDNNQNSWFIAVNLPTTNYSAILKICNPDLPTIRAFTDTSSRKYSIPIKFSGALKKICPNENQTFGFVILPETLCSYITIDSLKKN